MTQEEFMKEILNLTSERVTDMKNMTTTTFILVTFKKEKHMEKDYTHGRMENTMRENGIWAKNMDLVNGRVMEGRLT